LWARSSNLGFTRVNGQLRATTLLRSWLGDGNFFGLEAVVVVAVSVPDWGTVLHFGLVDFGWGIAKWALHGLRDLGGFLYLGISGMAATNF
jgi:hypothetical protein